MHVDPKDREKVIEQYTFTIKYLPGTNNEDGQTAAGIELDSTEGSRVSVGASNEALQGMLRQIIDLCQPLPILPGRRVELLRSRNTKGALADLHIIRYKTCFDEATLYTPDSSGT